MSLIINIVNLPQEGIEIKEEFQRGWLTNIPEYNHVNDKGYIKDQIKVAGHLMREGTNLHLRGRVELAIHTLCSRCGEEVDFPINSKFNLVLMSAKEEDEELEEVLTPDDLERLFYSGTEIDLTPYFQEQIALEIPMQILCRPDCKGVSPGCLKNLNADHCHCVRETGDPRLAVLRQLKIGK